MAEVAVAAKDNHHGLRDCIRAKAGGGGAGRWVDNSEGGDGLSGGYGGHGCCGDAEAAWRLLTAAVEPLGAAWTVRWRPHRLGPGERGDLRPVLRKSVISLASKKR